jgi:hypothetical protein
LRRPPRWIRRRPRLHAGWLERAAAGRGGRALAAVSAVAGTLALLWSQWPAIIEVLGPHAAIVALLAALQSSIWVQRGRQKWAARYADDWLSTLPATRRDRGQGIRLRTLVGPGVVALMLLGMTPLLEAAVPGSADATRQLLLGGGAAMLVGALLGLALPAWKAEPAAAAASTTRGFSRPATGAGLRALSRWPLLQTKLWFPPRLAARLVLPVMLLLPMGTSGNFAIALGGGWTLALYLLALLRATLFVAGEASRWLAPTPLASRRFAWAVGGRALGQQLQWTLIAAGLFIALGIRADLALRGAEAWLAIVTLTTSTALARASTPWKKGLRLVLSLCAVALLDRLRPWLALPGALAIVAWQWRRPASPGTSLR